MNTNPVPGTKDLDYIDIDIRQHIFSIAKKCFSLYGGQELDTPIFENFDNIKQLYGGEFNKQVFLVDDSSLMMRYDLTVPFARYVAKNGFKTYRRFQIGKVYRKDDPVPSQGRFREFYQCDYDIADVNDERSPQYDKEILCLTEHVLNTLSIGDFTIRLNYRPLIDEYLSNLQIDVAERISVCQKIDRLDKKSVEEVCMELKPQVAKFVTSIITVDNKLEFLYENKLISKDSKDQYTKILSDLKKIGLTHIKFDPLLVRGLDYYTGIIFEVYSPKVTASICAGGRYDGLIDKFSNQKGVKSIGMSLGVERIALLTSYKLESKIPQIYVATIGNLNVEKMKLMHELRQNGFSVTTSYNEDSKMKTHLKTVFDAGIPYMIILGSSEVESNTVKIKIIADKKEVVIARGEVINWFIKCK
jgi:histidyl-tRNA synthetase